MNLTDVAELVDLALLVPMDDPHDANCTWGLPLLLEGSPGIGKSKLIRQLGHRRGLPVETIFMGVRQPDDFAMIPVGLPDGSIHFEAMMACITRLMVDGSGILFLDEVTSSSKAVFNVAMSMTLDREYAGQKLPSGIRIMAACNPPEISEGLSVPVALANRFGHLKVQEAAVPEWRNYMHGNAKNTKKLPVIEEGEALIKARWDDAFARTVDLISGYLSKKPAMLNSMPAAGTEEYSHAWPSPRSWEFAARAYTTALILDQPIAAATLLEACVGSGVAGEFAAWIKEANLPSAEDILRGKWKPVDNRMDINAAALSVVSYWVTKVATQAELVQHGAAAWDFLGKLIDKGQADLILQPMSAIHKKIPKGTSPNVDAAMTPVLLQIGKKGLAKYLEA